MLADFLGLLLERLLQFSSACVYGGQRFLERLVKPIHHLHPFVLSGFDFVQIILHLCCKAHVENIRKGFGQKDIDGGSQVCGDQLPFFPQDVLPIQQRSDDLSIRAGPSDAFGFQFLDQRGFAVTRRGFGEMLFGLESEQFQRFPHTQIRRHFPLLFLLLFLFGFPIKDHKARKSDRGSRCPEKIVLRLHIHCDHVEDRLSHLAGHETIPDQTIEFVLIRREKFFHFLRRTGDPRRTDGLVCFLRPLSAFEHPGLRRKVFQSVRARNVLSRLRDGLRSHAHRIRPHIRNHPHGLAFEFYTFIQLLRDLHRLPRSEAQPAKRILLQRAGNKRRRRVAFLLFALYVGDSKRAVFQLRNDLLRAVLVRDRDLAAILLDQKRFEGITPRARQRRRDGPILLRLKAHDLRLALADQTQGHGLHPTGAQSSPDRLPEHRAHLVSHQSVQHSPRLLSVHFPHIQTGRMRHRLPDRLLGDLVEQNAIDVFLPLGDSVGHVPGNGLSLPIRIRRQQHGIRSLGRLLQFGKDLAFAGDHHVLGTKIVREVNAQLLLRQVAHVSHTCLDLIRFP